MTNSQTIPAPPNLFKTLVAGFDSITNHITLILFPIGLDLLIWLAPHFRLRGLIEAMFNDLVYKSLLSANADSSGTLEAAQEIWTMVAERFNLSVFLRSYPVGIPSIMSSVLPLKAPFGEPAFLEVTSLGSILSLFLVFTVLGLIFGTLYFSSVSQAALFGEIRLQQQLREWPWLSVQVILLALAWAALILGVSLPASCGISLAALGGITLGQCAVLLYSILMVWIVFPLLFSPHGIFVNREKAWPSIRKSMRMIRMTLPSTGLFFLSVFILTQLLDILWRIPPENSWIMLLGIAGHGFVATGLLAASFIYYDHADKWIKGVQAQVTTKISDSGISVK